MVLVAAVMLSTACNARVAITHQILGAATVRPARQQVVFPAERSGARTLWERHSDSGSFLVVRIDSEQDLQELADERGLYYLGYKAYACSPRTDWRAELASGPLFPSISPTDPSAPTSNGEHSYDIYLPVDLAAEIRPLDGVVGGVDLREKLREAESNGLCVVVVGAKPFGRGFRTDAKQVRVLVIDGRLETAGAAPSIATGERIE